MDVYDSENNLDKKYDIVIGPVANDAMTVLFRQYENGMIDFDIRRRRTNIHFIQKKPLAY